MIPEVDDPPAVVDRPGGVKEEPFRWRAIGVCVIVSLVQLFLSDPSELMRMPIAILSLSFGREADATPLSRLGARQPAPDLPAPQHQAPACAKLFGTTRASRRGRSSTASRAAASSSAPSSPCGRGCQRGVAAAVREEVADAREGRDGGPDADDRVAGSRGGRTACERIRVRLGALSHFTPEHFRKHFETLRVAHPLTAPTWRPGCDDPTPPRRRASFSNRSTSSLGASGPPGPAMREATDAGRGRGLDHGLRR